MQVELKYKQNHRDYTQAEIPVVVLYGTEKEFLHVNKLVVRPWPLMRKTIIISRIMFMCVDEFFDG